MPRKKSSLFPTAALGACSTTTFTVRFATWPARLGLPQRLRKTWSEATPGVLPLIVANAERGEPTALEGGVGWDRSGSRHGTAQHSTAQHSTAQYTTPHHTTARHAQCSTAHSTHSTHSTAIAYNALSVFQRHLSQEKSKAPAKVCSTRDSFTADSSWRLVIAAGVLS
jgi:hypothetical protein